MSQLKFQKVKQKTTKLDPNRSNINIRSLPQLRIKPHIDKGTTISYANQDSNLSPDTVHFLNKTSSANMSKAVAPGNVGNVKQSITRKCTVLDLLFDREVKNYIASFIFYDLNRDTIQNVNYFDFIKLGLFR